MAQQWMRLAALLLVALVAANPGGAHAADKFERLRKRISEHHGQGRFAEALPLANRLVAAARQRYGEEHTEFATAVDWLGRVLDALGRFGEAEPLYKRALAIWEKAENADQPTIASTMSHLARMYHRQARYAEAETLYKAALTIFETAHGPNHTSVGAVLNNLAFMYRGMGGRNSEVEPLYRRALQISETALGPDHASVGINLDNLAVFYRSTGRHAEAEPMFLRGLAIKEKALGPDHPAVAGSLANLGALYKAQGRLAEAEQLYLRSLSIREKSRGPDHPDVAKGLNNLALLHFVQGHWEHAVAYWRNSTRITVRRAQFDGEDVGLALTGRRKGEAELVSERFIGMIKAAHQLALADPAQSSRLANEMFEMAQWSRASEAATSLAKMAARSAKGNAALAGLVRERQDLVSEWQHRDQLRSAVYSQVPSRRDRAREAVNLKRLAAIDLRTAEIDKRLIAEFPDYAALSRPAPLTVEAVQGRLAADEAVVLLLDTPAWRPSLEETFIWIVTKTDVRWIRSDFGTPTLAREVFALRCGLDAAMWGEATAAARCRDLLNATPRRDPAGYITVEGLPFNAGRAHKLYVALFGQAEDLIRGKHLLIVPSGPLTQLPFQVLVTSTPAGDQLGAMPWLVRSHALTVLPAVSSLNALRAVVKPSTATKPMLGIGNPLLEGDPVNRPWEVQWARIARDKQDCVSHPAVELASERPRAVLRIATRSNRADPEQLRAQSPLHDTADELCAVAADLKIGSDDILLGSRATEANIKQLSDSGRLAQYRVVHFATHGTLAGDIEGTDEPGLILTPPKEQSELDDGFLSISEIAALKLDSDWVILSACNTAAGGAQGAEALSGLAAAFIYAGSRALLVSHWAVDSGATVKLITSAVGAMTRDAEIGRAQALRRAMLSMIDSDDARQSHPAAWAAFVVVGEGSSASRR